MGRKLLEQKAKIDPEQRYSPREALELLKDLEGAKFDESVEAHVHLNVDPRRADQMVRGTLMLPNGTGKTRRVAVFAEGEKAREAEEAGADVVGSDDLAARIKDQGFMDFDVAVATPDQMRAVGQLGPVLGPRGLMPNPKTGTVTEDTAKAIREVKAGRVEFKLDKNANIAVPVGKFSFSPEALAENGSAVIDAIVKARPSGAKGRFVENIALAATMTPGITVDAAPFLKS